MRDRKQTAILPHGIIVCFFFGLIGDINMKEKRCKQCGLVKSTAEFYSNWRNPDGYFSLCKPCLKENRAKEYQENKHHIIERAKRYYRQNKNHLLAGVREYQARNKDKIAARFRERFRECPEFKMMTNLRHRLHGALKRNTKAAHTMELIGCSKQDLIKHLEGQFKTGMTWDNYGKGGWVVDHILPCSSFNLVDAEEQKKCFNWKNLQPLWESDNIRKRDSLSCMVSL